MSDVDLTPREPIYPARKKVKMFSFGAILGFLWGAAYFK
jgi:hypothetical protein